jgi:polyisoprenoid-binding protein YceI
VGLAASITLGVLFFVPAVAAAPRQSVQTNPTPAPAFASLVSLTIDPAQSTVHWTVPSTLHVVHGTFTVTRGVMNFDPDSGKASGEIVVNAQSGDSGNGSRDKRLHKEILETARFPEALFRPTQVEGKVSPSGGCDVKVHGTLSVHGSEHQITALVHADLAGNTWKGSGKFDVPYVDWGSKDASNFLFKVNHVVSVEIDMSGSLEPGK